MSRPDFERLLADVQKDPELRESFRSASMERQGLARWTEERGYRLTDAEIAELVDSERELSDEDLEQAAGGDWGTGTGGTGTGGTGTGGTTGGGG